MNWADWVIVFIFVVSGLIGLYRGFAREALSLIVWIAAILVAKIFSGYLANILSAYIETPSLRTMTAFALLFVLTLLLGSILSYLVSALVRSTGLTGTDRMLGIIFGGARAFIIVMVLLIILPVFLSVDKDTWWKQAKLIPHFLACEEWVWIAYDQVSRWFTAIFGSIEVREKV